MYLYHDLVLVRMMCDLFSIIGRNCILIGLNHASFVELRHHFSLKEKNEII